MTRPMSEQAVLRLSIAMTFVVAAVGIGFGVASGSASIIFDGIYSLTDAVMTSVALLVSSLITRRLSERRQARLVQRFTMGFWHLEPMVLGLNGILLSGAAVYALVTAVGSLLTGGHPLQFGRAILYATVVLVVAISMAIHNRHANRSIRSNFVALDVQGWTISAALTGALLAAFVFGWAIQGTALAPLSPYVDPAVLALVCVIVIPLPVPTIRRALADILLITPSDMLAEIDAVARDVVARHGFLDHRAYVARVGRGRQIELYFIVPQGQPPSPLEEWDAIRDQIGKAIGGDITNRWLTIAFTTDPEWAD
ncbi:cation diffusion facilitator family transporter [Paracoccus sp. 228]|uniref:cation diffusion facilitator family transporter n=1 Tax=Paracoccus sp. 228 TaxID=1192054 RepID=UPI0005EA2AB1|nr:cation transporter [Paracoccus sp. 228]KIX16839.1 cation diffusion facilitator family transporter [Paracoccus sp. 228]